MTQALSDRIVTSYKREKGLSGYGDAWNGSTADRVYATPEIIFRRGFLSVRRVHFVDIQ